MLGNRAKDVVFSLQGGLGNQLFQYATGRAVSIRLGVPLLLDNRNYVYPLEASRPLLIKKFNIAAKVSARGNYPPLDRGYPLQKIRSALYKFGRPVLDERPLEHDTRLFDAKPGTYFRGFWQQESYFSDVSETLREDLTLRVPPSAANQAMIEKIQSTFAVAVHVRRGDYLQNTKFALCSMDYYARGAELIAARTKQDPTFFIFSDQPEWAAENLKLPGPIKTVGFNSHDNSYEDLRLMSLCRHNIIANSTFSWWGAWLNPHADKIVVAPKTWFLTPELSNEFVNASSFIVLENLDT